MGSFGIGSHGILLVAMVAGALATGARGAESVPSGSRGGPIKKQHLTSFPAERSPEQTAEDKRDLAAVQRYIPKLTHPRGDRWPILVWADTGTTPDHWQAWIERGVSPLFREVSNTEQTRKAMAKLTYFSDHGVPLVILSQGWVQRAFRTPPSGTGCDHLPPARPSHATVDEMEPNRDFTCPSWMYHNPAVAKHGESAVSVCEILKRNGIRPTSMWLDFESGAYLRNGAENEERLQMALAEAQKCGRCAKRFGIAALSTPQQYSAVVDAARAHAQRVGFVDPVRSVFPDVATGNFFAHPIRREPPVPGKYPAYGWNGSGFNVAQPRCYYIPGWRGAARDQRKMDWNVFYYCIEHFSSCARVLKPDEILVPWVGYVWSNRNAPKQAKRGYKIASPHGYRELAIHMLLRGAETIAVFAPNRPGTTFTADFSSLERAEMGPFILNVLDLQQGYNEILAFNDFLRRGRVLNYDLGGEYSLLNADSIAWSGVGTDDMALVRTVSFHEDQEAIVTLFGKQIKLPFGTQGRFFWVRADGTFEPTGLR
ncbi:MAG: hypothetical protein KAI66_02400 [Lentisphaeria bacterium]|nr:hypothetical protein [Lentisphaeria bacterium]